MKVSIVSVLAFLTALLVVCACGEVSQPSDDGASGGGGSSSECQGESQPILKIKELGPDDGQVPLGAPDALFLKTQFNLNCGVANQDRMSFYLYREAHAQDCVDFCDADPAEYCLEECDAQTILLNFVEARLVMNNVEVGKPTGLQKGTRWDGVPVATVEFSDMVTVQPGDNTFELRVHIAKAEAETFPGALIGQGFRAALGVVGFDPPVTIEIPILGTAGGVQTVVTP